MLNKSFIKQFERSYYVYALKQPKGGPYEQNTSYIRYKPINAPILNTGGSLK